MLASGSDQVGEERYKPQRSLSCSDSAFPAGARNGGSASWLLAMAYPDRSTSLDDVSSSSSYDSDDEYQLAEKEWQESLLQLQQLIAAVALPMIGKFFGRRWAYFRKPLPLLFIRFSYIARSIRSLPTPWSRKVILFGSLFVFTFAINFLLDEAY
jgi:hypothetical protein